MKFKLLITIALSILIFLPASSQNNGKKSREEMRREFKEFKIKFIAQEIEVGPTQMKEFTELYSQLEDERGKLFETTHKLEKSVKKNKEATEADYQKLNKAINDTKIKDAEISSRYDEKFSKILTPRQVVKMKDAEESFRRKMHEMRHNRKMKKKGK